MKKIFTFPVELIRAIVEFGLNQTEYGLVLKRMHKLRNKFDGDFWCGLFREVVLEVHDFQLRQLHSVNQIPRAWFNTEFKSEFLICVPVVSLTENFNKFNFHTLFQSSMWLKRAANASHFATSLTTRQRMPSKVFW
jgi:hypothetical protein